MWVVQGVDYYTPFHPTFHSSRPTFLLALFRSTLYKLNINNLHEKIKLSLPTYFTFDTLSSLLISLGKLNKHLKKSNKEQSYVN